MKLVELLVGASALIALSWAWTGCSRRSCVDDADCASGSICVSGGCSGADGGRFDLDVGRARLVYRNDTGRADIYDAQGHWILRGGTASVVAREPMRDPVTLEVAGVSRVRSVVEVDETDRLGTAHRIVITSASEATANVVWTISAYPEGGFFTFRVELVNDTGLELGLIKAATLRTEAEQGGGLFIGGTPPRHRILENGSYVLIDHVVRVVPGDVERSALLGDAIPGDFAGYSVSNWSHGVKDLDSEASWIAGTMTVESASPVFNLSYDERSAPSDPEGRTGFSYFSAEEAYLPEPKPVGAGDRFASELHYVEPAPKDVFEGLEAYAERIKAQQQIVLWQERSPENRIPNGWNSWSGSSGTGGYGTAINEDLMLANLDVMADQLRDWGMDWFQIDDGYEPTYGDWSWRTDRFPRGPRWLSDQIRARGLKPGLWIAPFTLYTDSQTLQEHPDWIADKTAYGRVLAGGYELLDLTHPEVKDWIRDLFRRFRQEWNFDWLKMDFAYWALLGTGFHDPTKTREEAYRDALRIVREEIGDETFFLAVAALGVHYGIVDSDRITVDNAPIWNWQPGVGDEDYLNQQGHKPTVRTAARRYYLHNRVWLNHPDLIIFRSHTDEEIPRVTLEEAQAFCTFVGLTGGIVKLGDRLLDLQPEHINSIRKLLPIYGRSARPLDLFTREFPEVWHLPVRETLDGYAEPYDLVGLVNWGRNFDLSTNPYTEMPGDVGSRTYEIDLESVGMGQPSYLAYEFWTGTFLGETQDRLTLDVPARTSRVVALRPKLGRPQFLGWNRQITMGGTDLEVVTWNEDAKTLTFRAKVARPTEQMPFQYDVAFHVPASFEFQSVEVSGDVSTHETRVDGPVLHLRFVPGATGRLSATLRFAGS